jgi:2-dehydropantoate 2-reductase
MTNQQQIVAIIGSGAIGSYYGGRLAEAGYDVRFLMRRDYKAVRGRGLRVTSPDGDFTITNPTIATNSHEIGPVDWVICALKTTAIEEAQELVRPCVSTNTRIVVLMNGLGIEERFAEWFTPERVFGGLAFIGVNRGEPGYVHHLEYGLLTLGHFHNDRNELDAAVSLWAPSKVKVTASPSLLRTRWEKLCWNIPFNGLAVAAGGITVDRIMGDPGLRSIARTLTEELIEAGNGDLASHSEDSRIDRTSVEGTFALTDTLGTYRPSTMIDFLEGKVMEIEAIFGEPLRRAQLLGIATPQLALLTALLRALNRQRQG